MEVKGQADNLRTLFQAAERNGLVAFRNRATTAGEEGQDVTLPEADCLALSPLFDGGQGNFAKGLFTELATDWPETAALAQTLSDLVDPGYDGHPLPVDLRSAGECGPSFLPWQALADPGQRLSATDEAVLTSALSKMDENLMRLLGVRIATRAALSDNMRLTRRISDMMIDAGVHGAHHHDRNPEHVLLDAILNLSRNPVAARARLSWLAERDGPEQLIAIDFLREMDAAGLADAAAIAQSELKRLSDSPDEVLRQGAQQRLLANAIEDSDIDLVAAMVTYNNNLTDDETSRQRLVARLEEAIGDDDPLIAIQALDVIGRMKAKGVVFTKELTRKADLRVAELTHDQAAAATEASKPDLPTGTTLGSLNAAELSNYLDELTDDLSAYEEVLNRG
jgi:hypothetical protein